MGSFETIRGRATNGQGILFQETPEDEAVRIAKGPLEQVA